MGGSLASSPRMGVHGGGHAYYLGTSLPTDVFYEGSYTRNFLCLRSSEAITVACHDMSLYAYYLTTFFRLPDSKSSCIHFT